MKIDSYAINMSAQSTSVKSVTVEERATIRLEPFSLQNLLGSQQGSAADQNDAAIVTLSPEGQAKANNNAETNQKAGEAKTFGAIELPDKYQLKLQLIEQLMQSLTGKKFSFKGFDAHRLGDPQNRQQGAPAMFGNVPTYKPIAMPIQAIPVFGLSAVSQRTETYYELQSMSFQASGVVNTSDGRQINFDMNILSSYEFSSTSSVIVSGRLMDPLVINFDGALPEFTKDRYAFDITIDGDLENIFMPTNGSGFLALDKDGNGKIDDGSELFGAKTGDGFGELSAYDADGNGWIDEGDEIFDKLKIMFADKETGEFMLMTLKEAGVGAIYLGSTNAGGYEIKAAGNETAGVVQRSGIFLKENGNVGSVHHIDLTY